MILVKIKATGQIIELMPSAAYPRLASGEAELYTPLESRHIAARIGVFFEHAARFVGAR